MFTVLRSSFVLRYVDDRFRLVRHVFDVEPAGCAQLGSVEEEDALRMTDRTDTEAKVDQRGRRRDG